MSAIAKNHITEDGLHRDLLTALTDDELAEQIAWYRQQRTLADGHARYGLGVTLSTALDVQAQRHVNEVS